VSQPLSQPSTSVRLRELAGRLSRHASDPTFPVSRFLFREFFRQAAELALEAADELERSEVVLEKTLEMIVEQPVRLTIELSASGPSTIREAMAKIAEDSGTSLEEFLEKDLGDVKKFVARVKGKKTS